MKEIFNTSTRTFSEEFNKRKALLNKIANKLSGVPPYMINDKYFIEMIESWESTLDKFITQSTENINKSKKAKSLFKSVIDLKSDYSKLKSIVGGNAKIESNYMLFRLTEYKKKTYELPSVSIILENFKYYPMDNIYDSFEVYKYLADKYNPSKYLILNSVDCSRWNDKSPYSIVHNISVIDRSLAMEDTTIDLYLSAPEDNGEISTENHRFKVR